MPKSSKPRTSKSKSANTDARRAVATRSTKTVKSDALSKHDQILGLLRRKQGASLDEIQEVSGWQAHSVRGFLAGTVKKRLGLKLSSNKSDGMRHYFVAQS
jgi:hypothetical protein